MTSRGLELTAAALSVGAGVVHAMVAPEHLEEWGGYGAFFIAAAAGQIAFAAVGVVTKVMEVGIIICLAQLLRMPIDDRAPVT